MILKLALTGIKTRLRDYLVLFSGLTIAASIFYMFQSMATNKAFLEASNTVKLVVVVFQLGTVLLAIITVVYILYANSFLMLLRQNTYAMFMMLGARAGKIAQLIFVETFVVGVIATVIGNIIGIGLTTSISSLLVTKLDLTIEKFSSVSISGIIVTSIFFSILFLFTAAINAWSIIKKPILLLLKEQATPKRVNIQSNALIFEMIIGLISLFVGYSVLSKIGEYKVLGIIIALITIVLGSYFLFHSFVIFILRLLKNIDTISMNKTNNFILSQLTFRIREYTQILTMVSILFAMALGALTVGLGFREQAITIANAQSTYDLVLNNSEKVNNNDIKKLNPSFDVIYHQKEESNVLYYNEQEFNQHPFQKKDSASQKISTYTGKELLNNSSILNSLAEYGTPEQQVKEVKLVSAEEFNQLLLPETSIRFMNVINFKENLTQLKELVNINKINNPSIEDSQINSQKYTLYQLINSVSSGFQFMGFFLGFAFLTMLASCLMFKVLSSTNSDKEKYQMLRKIGTRPYLLRKSLRIEIGVLFLLPCSLGIIHVLFGLQMFKELMKDPYQGILLSTGVFLFLYLIYYSLTIAIYNNIVLPKEKQ